MLIHLQMTSPFSSESFYRLSFKYTKHTAKKSVAVGLRRFKSFFGVSPEVCSIVWNLIRDQSEFDVEPKHLLWGLLFLKQCDVEHVRRAIIKSDEKTIRKWTWLVINLMAKMNVVNKILILC